MSGHWLYHDEAGEVVKPRYRWSASFGVWLFVRPQENVPWYGPWLYPDKRACG